MAGSFRGLFAPRSVAVVGASRRPESVGATLFTNILKEGFSGVVYPVNPSWPSVGGVRCYPRVQDLPEPPEMAVIIVPAPAVAETLELLGRRGTRQAVIISSGFKEVGGEGIERESALRAIAARYRMSLVGPNCFGVFNTDPAVRLNATFSNTLPTRGSVAFISQSGALGAGILNYARAQGIGFTRFVSVGNRAGLDENDLLPALAEDPATRVILLYVEALAQGRRFLEVAREVTERVPVLVIKSGRTPQGAQAALSHTGSLAQAQSDRLFDGLFEQAGVLRAQSLAELFQMAKVFSQKARHSGMRLAVLTNSGGPGIVAADAAVRSGLTLPALPEGTQQRLRSFLSVNGAFRNPVDMTADVSPRGYQRALRLLLRSAQVDNVLVIATPTGNTGGSEVVEAILRARDRSPKPVVSCLFGVADLTREVERLESAGVPNFVFPEEAVLALSKLARWSQWRVGRDRRPPHPSVDRLAARRRLRRARAQGRTSLAEFEAREVLEAYGIAFPPFGRARDEEGVLAAAEEIGYPVVLKAISPQILHKTEVGGVAANLRDPRALKEALAAMRASLKARAPQAVVEGFEVEKFVQGGREVILGIHRDPQFGPVLVFGLGGIYVEATQDVTFRLAPLRPLEAEGMVSAIQGFPLLGAFRGEPAGDLPALYDALYRISQLALDLPEVEELDVNPLLVLPEGKGVVAVDARIGLARDPSSRSAARP
jgi:acetyl coenzyme A synthetase (ADP forming)-like protein